VGRLKKAAALRPLWGFSIISTNKVPFWAPIFGLSTVLSTNHNFAHTPLHMGRLNEQMVGTVNGALPRLQS
jgi:hypothetical protein